jgi:hypothetical protein
MCAGNHRSSGLMKMTSSSRRIIMANLYARFKKIFTSGVSFLTFQSLFDKIGYFYFALL